ncbi:MAG TPA: lysophospholipid acyltransferase family protein [Candidatus Hydrogenedentes bacterium]|nr:lysophospholipid acyltransferase family protein [Candidatus Hydrogenedentota bacterium]
MDKKSPEFQERHRGNALGFWIFGFFLRIFGLRGAYGFLHFVCLYYLLFDRPAVAGADAYIQRRFPGGGFIRSRWRVYRLFISQGKQLIDRYAAIAGLVQFNIKAEGEEQLAELLRNRKEGLILLTAHIGNWQVALTTLRNLNRTVHLVMRPEDNEAVARALSLSRESDFIRIISPEADLDGVFQIMNALKQGDVVSIMGDRKYDFDAIDVSFLGAMAYFPYGAFVIAAAVGCPVVVLLPAKLSHKKYLIDVHNVLQPCYSGAAGKKESLRPYVQEFSNILSNYVEHYPYQCFLFHDVWRN